MGYTGCSGFLQMLAITVAIGAIIFALLGITRDIWWNNELGLIATQFTEREVQYLRRDFYWLEVAFVGLEAIAVVAMCVHTHLCFRRYEHRFHTSKKSKCFCYFIGVYLMLISFLTATSAYHYNQRLWVVQKEDKRSYVYKLEDPELDGSVQFEKIQSIFYYCHWSNGSPRDWARLKGLRIKKRGSHICQRFGSKVLAAVLSFYAGILYLFISRFFKSQRRDREAAHVVLLYELFGDYEEAKAEHFGQPFILKKYKDGLLKRQDELETGLTPRMKKLVRGENVEAEDDEQIIMPEKDIYHDELLFSETMLAQDELLKEQKELDKARGGRRDIHKFQNKVHPMPSDEDKKSKP